MVPTNKFMRARLKERIDFSPDLACFRFEPEEPVSFRPGQYATLGLEREDGKFIPRAYSIVSSPHEPILEFFIELVPEGQLTPRIWKLKPGDYIWMRRKIVGKFVLDEESGLQRHLMAATVTGIAPFLSMVRTQIIDLKEGRRVEPYEMAILHGASRSWELGIYLDELRALDKAHEWLTYIPTVSRPWEDTTWQGEVGRVDDIVRKYADNLDFVAGKAVAYACGHPNMIENVRSILRRARFEKEHFREEKYFT